MRGRPRPWPGAWPPSCAGLSEAAGRDHALRLAGWDSRTQQSAPGPGRARSVLDQGYQGVSGSVRNRDQGWGHQGPLISGSRVKSGSGQRPAPGRTWLQVTRILFGLFFFNSACRAMPAGSRSAAQSAGGRKKDEIWDLAKKRRRSDHERRQGDEREKRWVCKFCDRYS